MKWLYGWIVALVKVSPPTRGCELKYDVAEHFLQRRGHPPRGGAN